MCNDFSLGIELEGTDELPFTDAQYVSLIDLARQLLSAYPGITQQRICGHSDIAPGRKTDQARLLIGRAFAAPCRMEDTHDEFPGVGAGGVDREVLGPASAVAT